MSSKRTGAGGGGGAAATLGAGGVGGGGAPSTVINNIVNHNEKTINISVTNTNADAARGNWAGLYGIATGF